jgi:hypothetical protein
MVKIVLTKMLNLLVSVIQATTVTQETVIPAPNAKKTKNVLVLPLNHVFLEKYAWEV